LNLRSQLWWQMREALDPTANNGVALPPDRELLADLCAPKWSMSATTVKVESREDIQRRIGRSPDRASALILTLMDIPSIEELNEFVRSGKKKEYDPYANLEVGEISHYDPYYPK